MTGAQAQLDFSSRALTKPRQKDRILQWLRERGSITPLDALRELGCMRLGARIYELKQDGWQIETELIAHQNRWNETIHHAKYTLKTHPDLHTLLSTNRET